MLAAGRVEPAAVVRAEIQPERLARLEISTQGQAVAVQDITMLSALILAVVVQVLLLLPTLTPSKRQHLQT
jgi:hypothetical protein